MFERFTHGARQVVVIAQHEARALRHNYIGTEHLLLGLLHEEEGIAAQVLAALDVTLQEARAQVERIVGPGDEVRTGQIPFTPRAKKVLELSLREALSLSDDYIGTEHILLALAPEGGGVTAQILDDLDAGSEKIFAEFGQRLSKPITGNPLSSPPSRRVSIRVRSASPRWRLEELGHLWLLTIVAAGIGLGILIGWAIWGH